MEGPELTLRFNVDACSCNAHIGLPLIL